MGRNFALNMCWICGISRGPGHERDHDFADIIKDEEVRIVAESYGRAASGVRVSFQTPPGSGQERACTPLGLCKKLVAEHGARTDSDCQRSSGERPVRGKRGRRNSGIRPLNSSLTADVILEVSGYPERNDQLHADEDGSGGTRIIWMC